MFTDDSGQGLTEYALVLALIAIAVVASITVFGGTLSGYITDIKNALSCI